MSEPILKLLDYGSVGAIASVSVALVVWLIKSQQAEFDRCNERVDNMLVTQERFIESISRDMKDLVNQMREVTGAVSKIARKLEDEHRRMNDE